MSINSMNWFYLLFPITALSEALENADQCLTPNQELSFCTPLSYCSVIKAAILNLDKEAFEFAVESKCGYDNEPLICCGSATRKTDEVNICTTPNGERGKCKPLSACAVIFDTLQNENNYTNQFIEASECGYDNIKEEKWVCCGSHGSFVELSPLLPTRAVCGLKHIPKRVLGGQILNMKQYPWLALLRYSTSDGSDAGFKCGGSLINNRYVLTAAHCVILNPYEDYQLSSVRLGEWRISTEKDCKDNGVCADPVVDVKIEEDVVHDGYSRRHKKNDIALLRLERNVEYTDYINAICLLPLEEEEPFFNTVFEVAGWGMTENGSSSDYKLSVRIPYIPNDVCAPAVKQWGKITHESICAGGIDGKDSCSGDSGGPLVGQLQYSTKIQYFLEGIVSWGIECGIGKFPGVYTRVSKYRQWIVENLKEF